MANLCCILNEYVRCAKCDWILCGACTKEGPYYLHQKQSPKCPANDFLKIRVTDTKHLVFASDIEDLWQ